MQSRGGHAPTQHGNHGNLAAMKLRDDIANIDAQLELLDKEVASYGSGQTGESEFYQRAQVGCGSSLACLSSVLLQCPLRVFFSSLDLGH